MTHIQKACVFSVPIPDALLHLVPAHVLVYTQINGDSEAAVRNEHKQANMNKFLSNRRAAYLH